jgi:hypothetical protein
MFVREKMMILLILCSVQLVHPKAGQLRPPQRLNLASSYDETLLSKYAENEDVSKRTGENSLYHVDARKIGPGTLLVRVTFGMLQIKSMTYSIEGGGRMVTLDVAEVNFESDEGVVQLRARLPGASMQSGASSDQVSALKTGEGVGKYLLRLNEKYGRPTVAEKAAPNGLKRSEVMQWKVGDGYLEIETILGAGIVKEITYVIGDQKDKSHKKLKVKNVDLTKGEMTIELPGNADGEGKSLPGK